VRGRADKACRVLRVGGAGSGRLPRVLRVAGSLVSGIRFFETASGKHPPHARRAVPAPPRTNHNQLTAATSCTRKGLSTAATTTTAIAPVCSANTTTVVPGNNRLHCVCRREAILGHCRFQATAGTLLLIPLSHHLPQGDSNVVTMPCTSTHFTHSVTQRVTPYYQQNSHTNCVHLCARKSTITVSCSAVHGPHTLHAPHASPVHRTPCRRRAPPGPLRIPNRESNAL
jgi:hypothetical protein